MRLSPDAETVAGRKLRIRIPTVLIVAIAIAGCGRVPEPATTQSVVTSIPPTTDAPTITPPDTTQPATSQPTMTGVPSVEITIVVSGGEVVEDGGRKVVLIDSNIVLHVTSDLSDEVHVHGYDLFIDLEAGVEATIEFTADIPGIFEVELEGSHLLLFELEVRP